MQVRGMVAWTVTSALMGLVAGCGGSTNHNAHEASAGSGSSTDGNPRTGGATSGGAATGTSGAGTAAASAGGAQPDWTLSTFETTETFVSIGLWMGFPSNSLPIGTPTEPHDGSALHLVGTTDDAGLDVFFHTGQPVETIWSGVRFWVQSDRVGSQLTVAVAGPEPLYFEDRAQGVPWPQRVVTLSPAWQQVVVDFKDLGVDHQHLSPRSGPYGAFHFVIEPNTDYDLWIDDFVGSPYR